MGIFSDILLTVDFDRTLTAPDSTIPQQNIAAIHYFMDNGGTFTINTGRSVPMSTYNLIGKVPVNAPLLLYNGSAAYDSAAGKITRYTPIELDAKALVSDMQAQFPELHLEIQAVDAHYLTHKDSGWEKLCENNHCAWGYCTPEQVPKPLLKVSYYGTIRKDTVADMYEVIDEEVEIFDRAIAYVKKTYGHHLEIFRPCARIVDFHAKGVSKLQSARLLQQELGKKILVCVGDAENDITMLSGADYAYCPADGMVADRYETVCNCADGAIADVIYKKIPAIIQKQP